VIPTSRWRGFVGLVLALMIIALLLTAVLWLGMLLLAIGAVAWFNLVALPRVSARLRLPRLAVAIATLPLLAAAGWLLGGVSGVIAGCAVWVLGIVVPRLLVWRLGRRVRSRIRGSWSDGWIRLGPAREIEVDFRETR
jgi:hypothetical protein